MQILFIHQNFPGQYTHVAHALAQNPANTVVALGLSARPSLLHSSIKYCQYSIARGTSNDVHPLASETETKVIRGEACAHACQQLKEQGLFPDIICAHPGWGESLFISEVFPGVPILSYQEFYYHSSGLDTDFDPELQVNQSIDSRSKIRMKNAYLQLALESSAWNVVPTHFQASTFPAYARANMSVIHDGVGVPSMEFLGSIKGVDFDDKLSLKRGDKIVTFVNRTLEPYRGCQTFIRAIPELLRREPSAQIVVVGSTKGVSYGSPCHRGEWKDFCLSQIQGQYDPSRLHFVGKISHQKFLSLMAISACHVYLTYPFVLSWSLLEAMACSCPIVGSRTLPVQEVIHHQENGLLVDFFKPDMLALGIVELLQDKEKASKLGANARETVLSRYSLQRCLPKQLQLIDAVASRLIGSPS